VFLFVYTTNQEHNNRKAIEMKTEKLTKMFAKAAEAKSNKMVGMAKPYVDDPHIGIKDIAMTQANSLLCAARFFYSEKEDEFAASFKKLYPDEKYEGNDESEKAKCAFMKLIKMSIDNYAGFEFLVDTVGANQVKALKKENVDSLCTSRGCRSGPTNALDCINYWSCNMPRLVDMEQFSKKGQSDEWIRYHISASATGALCLLAAETPPYPEYFSPEEMTMITEACNRSFEMSLHRKLPDVTIMKAYCWLEVQGRLPNTWYMGKKAIGRISGLIQIGLTDNLKKAAQLLTKEFAPTDSDTTSSVAKRIEQVINRANKEIMKADVAK